MADKIHQFLLQLEPVISPVLKELRPLTQSYLPDHLINLGYQLYTKPVFDSIIINLDLFNPENSQYLELFLAKTLSFGILGASGAVKLPQILNIIKNGSTKGLSFISIFLETLSYLISIAYNFRSHNDFTTFGETVFVSIQNIIILILILYYSGSIQFINGFISVLGLLGYSLFADQSNPYVLSNSDIFKLIQFAIPLSILAKLPQIVSNFKRKSTGTLSIASIGAGLLGSFIRLFTLIANGIQDNLILVGLGVSIALNLVIFSQIIVFGNKSLKEKKAK
ncbi:hypothetical protein WICMUC_004931 [Wickerhamomyces mucosus]|uniref:Mannose-P-dolichol utilization defect 1 protein homolog n=1 Tax=Wickerhamomyces mucosus TaxID=1378264 RepID=A0A9P8T8I1_9ASCO|nr:hypothetical protein WICMUC_004931 [Wickerhamomyces mucosus]